MTSLSTLALAVAVALSVAPEQPGTPPADPDLAAADSAWRSGDYENVLPHVTKALKRPLTIEDRSRAWELAALAHAAFDRSDKAIESFRYLLSNDPAYLPGERVSPKVKGFFQKAHALGPLEDPDAAKLASAKPGDAPTKVNHPPDSMRGGDASVTSNVNANGAGAESAPVFKQWWFWTGVGAVAIAAGTAGVYAATRTPLPQGSLGTGALHR